MNTQNVPVLDTKGNVIGHVSENATSVAASKVANAPVQYRRVGRVYCWEVKTNA